LIQAYCERLVKLLAAIKSNWYSHSCVLRQGIAFQ
jgi:hypothetical protein